MPAPAAPPEDDPLVPFLAAVQLADSAFPSGRYAFSHGLESFVQAGAMTAGSGTHGLWSLLTDQLEHGIATADGIALAWAHRAVSRAPSPDRYDEQLALDADLRLTSVKLGREGRDASARAGRGMLGTVVGSFAGPALTAYAALVSTGTAPGNGAVVTGILTAELGVPRRHAVATELYAFAAGWLGAAVRLGVADHRVAQCVLHRCGPVIDRAVHGACRGGLDDMSSSTPLADVMSMRHEQAGLRMFMS
ncbi:hypothetical protein COUCH_15525 [Couchioplanes caeruleus]|uniref:urease accessory protein UreF n=1 Tax=Couchioplanes caeruleus TaxID=56438 RepID=UPI0020C12320|nr:urease accessory UreF family protein [Couchioplanes caeruleus]UQU67590.1 hypothetical protein COUCH_15525 [Couchioplanes caeruleus]